MSTNEDIEMQPIFEGGEEAAWTASKYLEARHIRSTITLAEDCRPGM